MRRSKASLQLPNGLTLTRSRTRRRKLKALLKQAITLADQQHGKLIDKPDLKSAMAYCSKTIRQISLTGIYSPHSLRYSWAQRALEHYKNKGTRDKESLALVSMELVHGDGRGRRGMDWDRDVSIKLTNKRILAVIGQSMHIIKFMVGYMRFLLIYNPNNSARYDKMTSEYKLVDYIEKYKSIMQFNKNKTVPIHQWYPFVEGYSKEFIQSILDELDYTPELVLEPFSGSGTTPVELQEKNIKCVSFEVSPFMHLLSSVKMRRDYSFSELESYLAIIIKTIKEPIPNIREIETVPFGRTLIRNENLKKWNYNDEVIDAILDIKYAINKITDIKYKNLFKIALGSILLEVSNLFRNGKCLSYKKDWVNKVQFKREDVHNIFINKINNIFLDDIKSISENTSTFSNFEFCHYGDVRKNIHLVPDNSVDLIITSPPYLNSRDYTDIYMLELKMLDLIKSYDELLSLRKQTLRSHVQVKYEDLDTLKIPLLEKCIEHIKQNQKTFWNSDLLNMIKGYFIDIDYLFLQFRKKMKPNKFIYFNVANSAYYGVEIVVDEIICQIAEKHGFQIKEIRKARLLKTSSQQSNSIKYLRESVIVMIS